MDRMQAALECAEIESSGFSVLEYLRECGCISPWGTWFRLQKEELGRRTWQITNGKGSDKMGRMTKEDRERIVEAALAGENPLRLLRDMGNQNPSAAWAYIKKMLAAANPERYGQLMKAEGIRKAMAVDAPETAPVTTCCAPARSSGVEVPEELPAELTAPISKMVIHADEPEASIAELLNGLGVTGLRTEYGEFHLSCNGYLYFGANDHDELEMPVEVWRKFWDDAPRIRKILKI